MLQFMRSKSQARLGNQTAATAGRITWPADGRRRPEDHRDPGERWRERKQAGTWQQGAESPPSPVGAGPGLLESILPTASCLPAPLSAVLSVFTERSLNHNSGHICYGSFLLWASHMVKNV